MRWTRTGAVPLVLTGIALLVAGPSAAATRSITTQLSASAVTTGTLVTDQGTLVGLGSNASGTVTYNVYPTSNCSGTATFSSVVIVTSSVVPPSAPFTAAPAGSYQWQAVYRPSPTQQLKSVCGSEPLVVTSAPGLTTVLSTSVALPGTVVTDQATLQGATSDASGTVTYSVYAAGDCSGGPVFTSAVPVSSGSVPTSGGFSAGQTGSYQWRAVYSGDSKNQPAASACGSEPLEIKSKLITTQLSISSTSTGAQVTDQATLVGVTSNAGGSVAYSVYSTPDCLGSPVFTSTVPVTNGTVPVSGSFTASPAGNYQWRAVYSGDLNNPSLASMCGSEPLAVLSTPALTTQLSAGSVLKDSPVTDGATLTGATSDATGTVTYSAYSTGDCSGAPSFTSNVNVAAGAVPASLAFRPDAAGTYQWQAVYSGDTKNAGATSTCGSEQLTVTLAPMVPLMDMGTSTTYYGFSGGLYADGSNTMAADHQAAGLALANQVTPLGTDGQPSPDGKIVLLSIGASQVSDEWCGTSSGCETPVSPSFMTSAAQSSNVNHSSLVIVNGAEAGLKAASWIDPAGATYDPVRDRRLAPLGLTEAQVQVVWLENLDVFATVSLPSPNADAYTLESYLGATLRAIRIRYPNVKLVFFSSRDYGGYTTFNQSPEPYAYEGGFAVKWLIQAQIGQMETGTIDPIAGDLNENAVAPWTAWGPYTWADGTNPRSDGLTWLKRDFGPDGTYPSAQGRTKVANLLMSFFLNSPFTRCWFATPGQTCS